MPEAKRLADQHRRAFDGDAWHGPHVFDLLSGVSATKASRKPIAGAHSIWELVRHIRAWEEFGRRMIGGSDTSPMKPEDDWPAVQDTSEKAWKAALAELRETHDALNRAIDALPDARLEELVPGRDFSFYVLLHGIVQHGLYHAGQIAILKKGA